MMRLDSVRELKAELTKSVITTLAGQVKVVGLPAQLITKVATSGSLGLGIAGKGSENYRLAVRIQRRDLERGSDLEFIRDKARGEVDVRYIGRVATQEEGRLWHQGRNRPLRIGSSIGHRDITGGTLGCFVRCRQDGSPRILSNNHVLAKENKGKVGDPILQPGRFDGGNVPEDVAGMLITFLKLKRKGINFVDCAVASVNAEIAFDAKNLNGLGELAGVSDVVIDEGTAVAKVGRTTGTTRGLVTAFELDNLVVQFGIGSLRFDRQIEIEGANGGPFSEGGDSGSLVVDEARKGVGLLFAGGDQGGTNGKGLSYANPLRAVFDELEVDLVY
jgi:hypothetical protein